jgi:hypothetical protein
MSDSQIIRGDRRQAMRTDPERRSRARTPGAFNDSCDAAYRVCRKYQIGTESTQTEVLLCEEAE